MLEPRNIPEPMTWPASLPDSALGLVQSGWPGPSVGPGRGSTGADGTGAEVTERHLAPRADSSPGTCAGLRGRSTSGA